MSPCRVCYDLDLELLKKRELPHYAKDTPPNEFGAGLTRLDEMAESGCAICKILRRGVDTVRDAWEPRADDYAHVNARFQILDCCVRAIVKVQSLACADIEYFTEADSNCPYPAFGPGDPIRSDPDVANAYEMIQDAIRDCMSHHPSCRPSDQIKRILPKRLLDLDVIPIRIYEPKAGENVQYAALSHCWGKGPLPKLTNSDPDIRFNWSDLPKSFQHAAKVTRRLGLRYLWIDAPCILQDDPLDWETEAAKMGSIYEGAYITISATSASGCAKGFLHKRNWTRISETTPEGRTKFTICVRPSASGVDEVRGLPHSWMLLPNPLPKDQYPLLGRGWCFQERILSSRVLHYTGDEFIFECNSGYRCECTAFRQNQVSFKMLQWHVRNPSSPLEAGIRESLTSDFQRQTRSYPSVAQIIKHLVDQNLTQHEAWALLMMLFTNTDLTYAEDTLPCLSALASRTQRQTSRTYLAGIWKEDIPACLAWQTYTYGTSSRPKRQKLFGGKSNDGLPPEYVAPSFSWISHVGRVIWCDVPTGSESRVHLVEAKCSPRGVDPFGEVADGFITLKGRLIAVQNSRVCEKSPSGAWSLTDLHISSQREAWDTPEDRQKTWESSRLWQQSLRNPPRNPPVNPVFFLWLCTTSPSLLDQVDPLDRRPPTIAIMLREAEKSPGSYRRVGLAFFDSDADFRKTTETLVRIV